jgi:hypothetical protein
MGLSLRIFLVNDDDSLKRLPLAKYRRMLRHKSRDFLQDYANKRVRYVMVVLDLLDREPVEILRIDYAFLKFDSKGRVDQSEKKKEARMAMESLSSMGEEQESEHLIDARHLFARKRYSDRYKWEPRLELEAKIVDAVFGET